MEDNLTKAFEECSDLVEKRIDLLLDDREFPDDVLIRAMRYSSLGAGKRIRPFLLMNVAKMFGLGFEDSVNAAVAVEFIHTYSLIHDDLPSMDDDDLRRSKPSCHKQFDEATAILAGDSLLTYAFEILAKSSTHIDPDVRCKIIEIIASSSGFRGMAGGQMLDLATANQKITKEEIVKLHRLKTGELFICCAEIGAIMAKAKQEEVKALKYYAHDLGLAFQIKDDILDHFGTHLDQSMEIDEYEHKKPRENASIVDVIGLDLAGQQMNLLRDQAINHLNIFGNRAEILIDLANFVVDRNH